MVIKKSPVIQTMAHTYKERIRFIPMLIWGDEQ